jgi:hypothetical protein
VESESPSPTMFQLVGPLADVLGGAEVDEDDGGLDE